MSTAPVKAHHMLMKNIVGTTMGDKKLEPRPEDFDLVSKVFLRAGGSWSKVFLGSSEDLTLLKKTLKVAAKKGFITSAPKWGG